MTMNDGWLADDRIHLDDFKGGVSMLVSEDSEQAEIQLSITDVESIHEWTGEWLKNRDLGRRVSG